MTTIIVTWLVGRWKYVVVAVVAFGGGVYVGWRAGTHEAPPAVQVVSQAGSPDAGVATARVTSSGVQEVASVTCRAEPPPPPEPVIKYLKGEPVQLACPSCPVLVCEGTASTRSGSQSAQADSPVLPPEVVTVQTHDSLRTWGIGPALGVSSELKLAPGVGVAWQPTKAIEIHGDVVWTGSGKIPLGLTADVLFRF